LNIYLTPKVDHFIYPLAYSGPLIRISSKIGSFVSFGNGRMNGWPERWTDERSRREHYVSTQSKLVV